MTTVTLAKHHGAGNDFLVLIDLDGSTPIDGAMARALCDRHRGIGADGLIRVARPDAGSAALLAFELRNADGSSAEMSGNGMRCLAQAALDAGLVRPGEAFGVETPGGIRIVSVRRAGAGASTKAWATVEMGRAVIGVSVVGGSVIDGSVIDGSVIGGSVIDGSVIDGSGERCNVGHGQLRVNLGNPHLVVLGPDPAGVAVEELGPTLAGGVPGGQNVEFVTLGPGPDELTMRVWERGVGETLACGTGACAAAVAAAHWGRVGPLVTVHQRGGDADVELREDGTVVLAGPVERVGMCLAELDGVGMPA